MTHMGMQECVILWIISRSNFAVLAQQAVGCAPLLSAHPTHQLTHLTCVVAQLWLLCCHRTAFLLAIIFPVR